MSLMQFVAGKLKSKMRQVDLGPKCFPRGSVGELADRLCVLTLQVRSSKCVSIQTVREMEHIHDVLAGRGFDFYSAHYEMLFKVISEIERTRRVEGNLMSLIPLDERVTKARQGLRQSLVETISAIHRDPRTPGPPV